MRARRSGKGLLPPNPLQWTAENHGLDLREQLGVELDAVLPHLAAFALLPGVTVLPHGDVPAAALHLDYFRAPGKARWSGLAMPLGDGEVLVLFNDAHPPTRTRATLMEEYFHLKLGHPPSRIRLLDGAAGHRTHDKTTESEAYACGAAALVPFRPLKEMYSSGTGPSAIAKAFEVSPDLVIFRLKVTRQLRRARRA